MKGLYAVYRKEMGHYFVSPIVYITGGVFLLLCGIGFHLTLVRLVEMAFEQAIEGRFGGGLDVPSQLAESFFWFAAFLLLFLMPIFTMGLYAEERRRGTMELLMTSPLTDVEIVLGKFLASLSSFALMLLPTAAYMTYAFAHSDPAPPWRILLAGYLGVLLFAGALLAFGAFFSSLTESQIISAVLALAAFFILWMIDIFGSQSLTGSGAILRYLSILQHYGDFSRGVIDTTGLIYFGSLIALGLFLTARSLDSMRWRRA